MWVVVQSGHLYFFSAGEAGKIKRLRHNQACEIALCDMQGNVSSPWTQGQATLIDEHDKKRSVYRAMRDKYGWQMLAADIGGRLIGRYGRRAVIRVGIGDR